MDKEALQYGFKAYEDKDEAVPLIVDANNGDFDAAMELVNLEKKDRDYGLGDINRKSLVKLDKKYNFSDHLRNSDGFVEEQNGFIKNKPDIYMTPEGAMVASNFIRQEVLPNYGDVQNLEDKALDRELKINQKMENKILKHRERQSVFDNVIQNKKMEITVDKNQNGILPVIRSTSANLLLTAAKTGRKIDEKVFRKEIDRYKKGMANIPDAVAYSRFADAIENASTDNNELLNFRYY